MSHHYHHDALHHLGPPNPATQMGMAAMAHMLAPPGGAQETGTQTGAKDASHLLRMPQEF